MKAESALLAVIEKSATTAALCLIEAGADIEDRSVEGFTPLNLAVYYNLPVVVSALIAKGADLNAAERNWGMSPLMHAVEYQRVGIARMLVEAGADIAQKDSLGKSVFDLAPPGSEMEALLKEAPAIQRHNAAKKAANDASNRIARLKAYAAKLKPKAGP